MNHFGQELPPTQEAIDNYPGVPVALITVDQWIDMHRGTRNFNPEQRLFFAVLEDALRSISKAGKTYENRRLENRKLDALEWINGGDATLTFDQVCEVLDIDPAWLRDGLNRKQDLEIARKSPAGTSNYHPLSMPAQRLSGSGRTVNHAGLSNHLYCAKR